MDTSKEYIKMCEMAEEIQKAKKFLSGSDVAATSKEWSYVIDKNTIWLPRQDQLQKMVDNDFVAFAKEILEWNSMNPRNPSVFNKMQPKASGEQLWLAFVMQEKYNKTWEGEKWQILKQ